MRFALIAIAITAFFSSAASAQIVQKPLRWLGHGFSAGYNRCNPGPNADYYNPWSAHNSMLISKMPRFQNQNFQSYNLSNLDSRPIYQGIPHSVYAAPQSQYNYGHGMHGVPSVYNKGGNGTGVQSDSVDSSFEPYDMEDEEDQEDQEEVDEDEWNDDENEWSEEDSENDSASIDAPVPGKSAFSKSSYKTGNTGPSAAGQPKDQELQLFNPFSTTGQ